MTSFHIALLIYGAGFGYALATVRRDIPWRERLFIAVLWPLTLTERS